MDFTGRCLCGGIAYAFTADENAVADYCHCRECRRASGAPVVAWVQVRPSQFRVTQGEAKAYASSARAVRWFCPNCGSPLYMTDTAGISVGITLGTLDHPENLPPTVHGWDSERLPWFQTTDELPRYEREPPYDLGE
jgi:hypothetical protein